MLCKNCPAEATHRVGDNTVCEPCADAMVACAHPSGQRIQKYDSDGCGYYLWRCDGCGAVMNDSMG